MALHVHVHDGRKWKTKDAVKHDPKNGQFSGSGGSSGGITGPSAHRAMANQLRRAVSNHQKEFGKPHPNASILESQAKEAEALADKLEKHNK